MNNWYLNKQEAAAAAILLRMAKDAVDAHGERVEASAVIGGSSTAVIETVNSVKDLCLYSMMH
jgi:hypothetical protein